MVTVACMLFLSGQLSKRHARNAREKFWFENDQIVEDFQVPEEIRIRDVADVGYPENLGRADEDKLDAGDEKNIALVGEKVFKY